MYTDFKEEFLLQFLFKTYPCTICRKRQPARGAFANNVSTGFATFGAQIDNMIGTLDHLYVVLDNNNGVPSLNQCIKSFQECFDIMKMQPGGGFVENERVGSAFSSPK